MFRGEKRGPVIAFFALALVFALNSVVVAQAGTISGTVKAKDGRPLAYANVMLIEPSGEQQEKHAGSTFMAGVHLV